ncbi:MAG: hypothetical protein GY855_12980 [candidate division Zixibacteria bacterium]|nr:hypothetical protein [candidate division Zixibacteria bacterium]
MELKVNKNGEGFGIAVHDESVFYVRIDATSGKLKLINAAEVKYSESDDRNIRHWRGSVMENKIRIVEETGECMKYCVPYKHLLTKKINVNSALADDIPDWLEWSLRQSLPKTDGIFAFDFYSLGENNINESEYIASIFPESVIDFMKSLRKNDDINIKPVSETVALYESIKLRDSSKISPFEFLLNFNCDYASYIAVSKTKFIADGHFEIRDNFKDSASLEYFVTDMQTAMNFHLNEEFPPEECSVILCGDINVESEIVKVLTSTLKTKISFLKPFENFEISDEVERLDDIKRNQHRFTSAIGTALTISSFSNKNAEEIPHTG